MLAAAGLALAIPGVAIAVGAPEARPIADKAIASLPFTPANVDPQLALKVASVMGHAGLRFTPASKALRVKDRVVTVAVRVDPETARAISVRNAITDASASEGRTGALALAPTRYNLGIAKGYQSFAAPAKPAVAAGAGLQDLRLPELAAYSLDTSATHKPSRFQSRIALEQEQKLGRLARGTESLGEQSIDVRGSYRLGRNLDVTAGVRLSQDRDRLDPLTDGVEDDQAVYVGTQIRF